MVTKNSTRILIWVIVILLATNLSMGLSFWYHRQQDKKIAETNSEQVEMPSEQRTRFFRDQLNLNQEQVNVFRDLNRSYNRSARQVSDEMEQLRIEMVNEMGNAEPSKENLDSIAIKIGNLHTEMKKLTMDYFMKMKEVCDSSQQEKLKEIFLTASKSKEDVSLPQRGRRFGRNQKN
jgi:Heavy-metal resistance